MRIIVTGAASGIGRACVSALVASAKAEGATPSFVLADLQSDALERVAAELKEQSIRAVEICGNLADPSFAGKLAECAERELGGLDVLVSNAGVLMTAPLHEMTVADWDRMFDTNTRATWLLAKACYRLLRLSSRASVIATASISGTQPTPPHGAYSASKAALIMLVRQMAYEWGPDGIRCNCVSPGMVHTNMTDAVYGDPARRAERASRIPLRRVADPEDIAGVVAFLAGKASQYVTGVDLAVDGGVQTALMPSLRGSNH